MDTISNLLTSIRNAEMARHTDVTVPASKLSTAVVAILKENGYVGEYSETDGSLTIVLKYASTPHSYRRISKPGRRLYVEASKIPTVRSGKGIMVISTSKGVMSSRQARKQKVGGEILCEVY